MFYFSLGLFFIFKTFFNDFDYVLTLLFLGASLYYFHLRKDKCISYYLLAVLTNGGILILLGNAIYFFLWVTTKLKSCPYVKKHELYYLLFIFVFSLFLTLHHSSTHDVLRYALLITSPAFFLLCLTVKMTLSTVSKSVLLIYITSMLSNFIYILFIVQVERLSIFTGTENISLIIFSMLLLQILKSNFKLIINLFCLLLFLLYLLTLGSRSTIFVILILLVPYILSIRVKSKYALLVLTSTIFISLSVYYSGNSFMDIPNENRAVSIFETIDKSDIGWDDLIQIGTGDVDFSNFSSIDIRARIYSEAIYLINQKPWFGYGVKSPKVFENTWGHKGVSSFHSSIFDVWVTYGVIGVIVFCFFIYSLYKWIIKGLSEKKHLFQSLFFVFIILSFIQPYLFHIQVLSLWFLSFLLFKKIKND